VAFVGTQGTTQSFTLPTITATMVGMPFEWSNCSTTAGTSCALVTASGQGFNKGTNKTLTMAPASGATAGQYGNIRAQADGSGGYFWQIIGTNGSFSA
jgi:hypothetical protein